MWVRREEGVQEKITMKNGMIFKPEEMYKHSLLSDEEEKKLEIRNSEL